MDFKQVIRTAAARIKGPGVLTGTAALWMRGYAVTPGDVDFLVEFPQATAAQDGVEPGSTERSYRTTIDGVKVDYIFADEARKPFMTTQPDVIDGVPVASVADVLGIKRFAGRVKDERFLADWDAGKIGPPVFVES